MVAEPTNDDYRAIVVRSRVEVGRREHFLRVAEDAKASWTVEDADIVVDAEVWIIRVLVLAANLHEATIRKLGERGTETVIALDWAAQNVGVVERRLRSVSIHASADHLSPKWDIHFLRI